jgi:hypothetical protein
MINLQKLLGYCSRLESDWRASGLCTTWTHFVPGRAWGREHGTALARCSTGYEWSIGRWTGDGECSGLSRKGDLQCAVQSVASAVGSGEVPEDVTADRPLRRLGAYVPGSSRL